MGRDRPLRTWSVLQLADGFASCHPRGGGGRFLGRGACLARMLASGGDACRPTSSRGRSDRVLPWHRRRTAIRRRRGYHEDRRLKQITGRDFVRILERRGWTNNVFMAAVTSWMPQMANGEFRSQSMRLKALRSDCCRRSSSRQVWANRISKVKTTPEQRDPPAGGKSPNRSKVRSTHSGTSESC